MPPPPYLAQRALHTCSASWCVCVCVLPARLCALCPCPSPASQRKGTPHAHQLTACVSDGVWPPRSSSHRAAPGPRCDPISTSRRFGHRAEHLPRDRCVRSAASPVATASSCTLRHLPLTTSFGPKRDMSLQWALYYGQCPSCCGRSGLRRAQCRRGSRLRRTPRPPSRPASVVAAGVCRKAAIHRIYFLA